MNTKTLTPALSHPLRQSDSAASRMGEGETFDGWGYVPVQGVIERAGRHSLSHRMGEGQGEGSFLENPLRVFLVLAVVFLLDGTGGSALAQSFIPNSRTLAWPPPPDEPRITYVETIHDPAETGFKPSFFGRVRGWLTGSQAGYEPLIKPFGVALDEHDNLCLTDTGANVVCVLDRTRKKWRRWEKAGQTQFLSPVAVAKRNGTIYVADSSLRSVVAIDESGKWQFELTNHLERPSGLAIWKGCLAVADSSRHAVVIFDLKGNFLSEFGSRGAGEGEFNFPTHVAADDSNRLFVIDSMNSRVQVFDAEGRFLRRIGARGDVPGCFSRPKGVAVDSFGHVYVVDAMFGNVQLFDGEGRLLMAFGRSGSQPGEFWLPNGIVISRDNRIYVADCYNHRIQVFQFLGP